MVRIIPNEESWIGFATAVADIQNPTVAEITAAINLTSETISLNASSQGNVVPTPSFDSLFETSIVGTSSATFTADFYRDDDTLKDTAWTTLPRGTQGFFIISRFGGTGTAHAPVATDKVEVWPVTVVSRTMANMSSNTVLTFTVTCAVNEVPAESATVHA